VVRPRDVAGLAGAINILLGDDALREKLGAGGRRMVETEYTEELMGERYYQLYLDILGAGALPVRAGVLGASTRSVVGVTS
jgi:glycosyltransferase involved in cell wall biosynthesis